MDRSDMIKVGFLVSKTIIPEAGSTFSSPQHAASLLVGGLLRNIPRVHQAPNSRGLLHRAMPKVFFNDAERAMVKYISASW